MQKGFIILCGPSGVGKSTLRDEVLKSMPEALAPALSCTTRPQRPYEKDGKDYVFLNDADFLKEKESGRLIESAQIYGHWYGTRKKEVESAWKKGLSVIKDVDIQGLKAIKRIYSWSLAVGVLISSPEELKQRILKRNTEFGENLDKRLQSYRRESLEISKHADIQIFNDDFQKTAKNLKKEIEKYLKTL